MNSIAGATEGKLGSIMEVCVEDTVEPSGQIELLRDQAAAKESWLLWWLAGSFCCFSLTLPQSMCGGVGEVCLCGWPLTLQGRPAAVGWVSFLSCLKSSWQSDAEVAGRHGWLGDVLQLSWLKLSLKLLEEPVVSSVAWSYLDGLFQSLVLLDSLCVKMGVPLVCLSGLFMNCRV